MSDKQEQSEIYNMKLHQARRILRDDIRVIRVPGGWIYESIDEGKVSAAVFVPFNDEFQREA